MSDHIYDKEAATCTGCGSMLPERHEDIGWCPQCAPEMHGADREK